MSNIIPFESAKLPAYLQAGVELSDDLGSSFVSFPTMSIKGKVFTLKRGEEKTVLTRDLDGEKIPAPSIEVVILKAFPAGNNYARTYYSTGFVEGTDAQPDCYSDDGVAPAANVQEKQSNKCALCPMNVKGSKVSDDGTLSKACASSKILAIATPDNLEDPIKVRVPGKSTIALKDFGELAKKRGFPYHAIVARIGFETGSAFPELTFKPVGFLSEEQFHKASEVRESELVGHIVGSIGREAPALPAPTAPTEEKAAAPAPAPKPTTKPKPAAAPKPPVVDDLPTTPKTTVKVETPPAPAQVIESGIDEGMSASLDDLDFDD